MPYKICNRCGKGFYGSICPTCPEEKPGVVSSFRHEASHTGPICSHCGDSLKLVPSFLDRGGPGVVNIGDSAKFRADHQLYGGTICASCRKIRCANCNPPMAQICPDCSGELKPCYAKYVSAPPPPDRRELSPEAKTLVGERRMIEAVRLHYEQTGCSLMEAKAAVDAFVSSR